MDIFMRKWLYYYCDQSYYCVVSILTDDAFTVTNTGL